MNKLLNTLNKIHRPRLLIQAARIGAATYKRELRLRRLFMPGRTPVNAHTLERLMKMEEALNEDRLSNEASYCAADHVDILIAMIGEARLLHTLNGQPKSEPEMLWVKPKARFDPG